MRLCHLFTFLPAHRAATLLALALAASPPAFAVDTDKDGVPDAVDASPFNAAINNEVVLPLNGSFGGASIREQVRMQ